MRAQADVKSFLHRIDVTIRRMLHDAHARIERHEAREQLGKRQLGERDRAGEADGAAWLGHPSPHDVFCGFRLDQRGNRVRVELMWGPLIPELSEVLRGV